MNSLKHHFLIAMPALADSFFYQAVVYLCEHDEQGAMGLIVNKPTEVSVQALLTHLQIENPSPCVETMPVYFGGPVQRGQGMVLHDSRQPWKTAMALSDTLFLTTSTDILDKLGTDEGPEHAIVTLGYAGWSAGQLEQEIAENSWLTVKADERILFDTPANERWQKAAQLLGVDIRLMSDITGQA